MKENSDQIVKNIKPAATKTGAQNNDYKVFIVKDAIMSHSSEYTKNVEAMFDAVSYDVISLILENS